VLLAEGDIQLADPLPIAVAELAVLIPLGVGLFVLVPQELQGDTLPLEFLEKVLHGGHPPIGRGKRGVMREQHTLKGGVIEGRVQGPRQTSQSNPIQVISHGAVREGATPGDLPVAHLVVGLESKDFDNLAHGKSPHRHG
jgi:hypothetical protein